MMLLEILILISAFPFGYLVAWLARDELLDGRKWFIAIIVASAIAGLVLLVLGEFASALTAVFIIIFTSVALWKSHDKVWTKRRI